MIRRREYLLILVLHRCKNFSPFLIIYWRTVLCGEGFAAHTRRRYPPSLNTRHSPPNTHSPQTIEACISHHICSQQAGKLPHTYEISSNHPIIILLFSWRKHCWRTSATLPTHVSSIADKGQQCLAMQFTWINNVNSDNLQSPRKVVAYAYI